LVTAKTLAVADLIAAVYEHHPCGGGLHIVLDDWNLDDASLATCADLIRNPAFPDVTRKQLAAERACLRALQAMTEEERGSALAIHDGYLARAG